MGNRPKRSLVTGRAIADRFRRLKAWLGRATGEQTGALCWRHGRDGVEVLLVTTRRTGRWTPPKGGVKSAETFAQAAAREAWEEAGVVGRPSPDPVGVYHYLKFRKSGAWEKLRVDLHAVEVDRVEGDYPEAAERRSCWAKRTDAARMVRERRLGRLIAAFDPSTPPG